MESLPQVSAAMEQVLTTVADEAAAALGFVQRRRVLSGALFVQALVLGWLARPDATLHQLTQTLAARGARISPQGLARRFGPAAAALLERVLAAAIAIPVRADPVALPLLTRFPGGVWVLDCTTIRLPDALAAVWRGCGGRTGHGTQAALKVQVRLDLAGGELEGPVLLAGRTQDKAGPLHTAPLPAGALGLADLGFWSLERLRAIGAAGAFWLSRLDPHTHVCGSRCPPGWRRRAPSPSRQRCCSGPRRGCRRGCWPRVCRKRSPTSGGASCGQRQSGKAQRPRRPRWPWPTGPSTSPTCRPSA
jgi:hypothetical protein